MSPEKEGTSGAGGPLQTLANYVRFGDSERCMRGRGRRGEAPGSQRLGGSTFSVYRTLGPRGYRGRE